MTEAGFSVFLIKINAMSLRQAEAYLRNRNWVIGSAVSMREALAYIIQKQPEYVLICADHPNKKIRILPKLLSQAFPVKIIAYTESGSPSALQALREMGQKNTLFPPISGPAIERMVLKARKDEQTEAERLRREKENPGSTTAQEGNDPSQDVSGILRFKTDQPESGDLQKSFEQARAALNQLVNSNDDDEISGSVAYTPDHSQPATDDQGYYLAKGDGLSSIGKAKQEGAGAGSMHAENQEGPGRGHAFAATQEGAGQGKEYSASQVDPEALEYFEKQSGPDNSENAETQNGRESEAARGTRSRGKSSPIMESRGVKPRTKKNAVYIHGEETDSQKIESIIVRGAVEALDESVIQKSGLQEAEINEIDQSSNIACIIVESARFSGYLIAALGKNRKIDQTFIDMVKSRLFSFLKANGENLLSEDAMGLKIQEVEFEGWALEQAEFLKKTVHDGDEIAMAFFPHQEIAAKLEDSASEKMVKLSLDELKENVALEFDLYMYMPENNKYLLYTPQGKPLAGEQKGRLTEKGVKHMHLRKESIGEVKKYRAQNYLNEKIEAFKAAKKIKQG